MVKIIYFILLKLYIFLVLTRLLFRLIMKRVRRNILWWIIILGMLFKVTSLNSFYFKINEFIKSLSIQSLILIFFFAGVATPTFVVNGINLYPLFHVFFYTWEGNLACVLACAHIFFNWTSSYFFKAPFPPLFSIFLYVFSLFYYATVLFIFLHWPYSSFFISIFIFFEIIIFITKWDLGDFSKLIRIPLLGFYAGLLAIPAEIVAASDGYNYSGLFAFMTLAYWLYDITGIPVNFWCDLNNKIVVIDDFLFSEQFYNWLVINFSRPLWVFFTLISVVLFALTYVFEKQWQYLISLFNLKLLRTLSILLPLGFFTFFFKNWVYFHMFVFVILCSEIIIYLIHRFGSNYAWMLRFPVAGFLAGVISMPVENVPLDMADYPRGYVATWLFIYSIWDSHLFDFSLNNIVDFHDFLVTFSDPVVYFFDTVLGNAALVNALYAVIYAVTILTIIIVIAFFTVFERKVLAAVQRRRGPNIVGFWGLFQAIADALKLLSKEPLFVSGVNYYIFLLAPIFLFTVSLTAWVFIPIPGYQFGINSSYTFLLVFLITGLNSFAIILAGISSNSRYSLIGGIRAIAQLISYEIPLSISLLILFIIQGSYDLHKFIATKIILVAVSLPVLFIFFICLLAETNRTPFDLPEAEAELVAGYNLEYSSILFALFFLAEYNNIMIASSLLSIMVFGESFFYIGVIIFCAIIIFVRAILPRYTFAQLINLCWTVLLPATLLLLLFLVVFMYLFDISTYSLIRPDVVEAVDGILKNNKVLNFFSFISSIQNFNVVETPKINVFIFFIVAFAITSLLVFINWVLVNFKSNNRKNSPYECGFEPVGSPVSDFTPNFLAVALIFLIYDVEILLTFPWAYSFYAKSAIAIFCFVFFLIILILGLIYEILDDSFHVY